ncbi:Imm26 family immunity protein [Fictibacillus iocasae]|uniref:Imm26 family immunity protein n=1 Tax=Fictibacillus iocasae TaxID=2715437 RepID=A0ABW2NP79_9BACL
MNTSCRIGMIDVFLPDASTSYFRIDDDLAEYFHLETNDEAVKWLRKTLREKIEPKLYKRILIDYESSAVMIRTTSSDLILETAVIINEMAHSNLSEEEAAIARKQLLSHKRPKKQKWKVGDIFQVPLENGTYTFGQVVWKSYTHPVCGLLDLHLSDVPPLEDFIPPSFIAVLSITPNFLDNHRWKVLGNLAVAIQVEDVPEEFRGTDDAGAMSFTSGILEDLANAFFGVTPWNVSADEDFFDEILLPSVKRRSTAIVLSSTKRTLYRREQKWE